MVKRGHRWFGNGIFGDPWELTDKEAIISYTLEHLLRVSEQAHSSFVYIGTSPGDQ